MAPSKETGTDLKTSRISKGCIVLVTAFALVAGAAAADESQDTCVILSGLGGVPEYEENFTKWSESLESLCSDQLGASVRSVDGRTQRREEMLSLFEDLASLPGMGRVWLFLVGHATHDGRDYKFNIRGPDLTGADLETILESLGSRTVFVVLGTSSSGGLVPRLADQGRVIISATKSESEKRPPLFLSFFIEGASSAESDTNKDRKVSLREAFEFTQIRVQEWYEGKGRLQTEHPVLDDSKGQGSLAMFAYLSTPPEQAYRTLEAKQLAPERQRIEREIEDLKLRKTELTTAEYYATLERLLIELAELNEKIRILEGGDQ